MTVKKKAPAKKKQPVKAAKKAPAPKVKKRPKKRAKKFTEPILKIEGEHDYDHVPGDHHEPVMLGDVEWRDKVGRKRALTTPWLVVKCNRPDCPYRVLVEQFSLAQFISEKAAL